MDGLTPLELAKQLDKQAIYKLIQQKQNLPTQPQLTNNNNNTEPPKSDPFLENQLKELLVQLDNEKTKCSQLASALQQAKTEASSFKQLEVEKVDLLQKNKDLEVQVQQQASQLGKLQQQLEDAKSQPSTPSEPQLDESSRNEAKELKEKIEKNLSHISEVTHL